MNKIEKIKASVTGGYDHGFEVEYAFNLGLHFKRFPNFCFDLLEMQWQYKYSKELPLDAPAAVTFISDDSTSWHNFYRSWREKGWERKEVKREGGLIQYLMESFDESLPEGHKSFLVRLDITLATCKRVSKGMKTVEVEEFETVCEDLVEPEETLDEEV